MIDRFLAGGFERRDASRSIDALTVRLHLLGETFTNAFAAESHAITDERKRMAVTIPGLMLSALRASLPYHRMICRDEALDRTDAMMLSFAAAARSRLSRVHKVVSGVRRTAARRCTST